MRVIESQRIRSDSTESHEVDTMLDALPADAAGKKFAFGHPGLARVSDEHPRIAHVIEEVEDSTSLVSTPIRLGKEHPRIALATAGTIVAFLGVRKFTRSSQG